MITAGCWIWWLFGVEINSRTCLKHAHLWFLLLQHLNDWFGQRMSKEAFHTVKHHQTSLIPPVDWVESLGFFVHPRQLTEGVTALGDMEGSLPVRDSWNPSVRFATCGATLSLRNCHRFGGKKVTTSMWFAQCSISATVDTMSRETWFNRIFSVKKNIGEDFLEFQSPDR